MRSAKEALIYESITLPLEIKNKIIKDVQISFHFSDGTIHHVKPPKKISKKLAISALRDQKKAYKNWSFLNEEDTEV